MADTENRVSSGGIDQEQVHREGVDYIKGQVSNNQQHDGPGTASGPHIPNESTTREEPHRGDSAVEREEPVAQHKPPKAAGPDAGVSHGKGSLENRDAIPTAGGQRLGEEHWGESKIVPDVPKPTEGGGVASADGQPSDETAANTAKNTGGASSAAGGPHHGSGEKRSVVDKVKDKLNIGKKE